MKQTLKESALDWVRMIEDVSAAAVTEIRNWYTPDAAQAARLDLLFRSYWLGDLDYRIDCADSWNESARREIRKMVRGSVFDSIFSRLENHAAREAARRFLTLCSRYNLYRRKDLFHHFLEMILEQEDVTGPAAAVGKVMESRIMIHILERRHKNRIIFGWPKRPDPDDPPPGMDEFEYIDWNMSR